jgi:hypothetical protein
VPLDLADGQHGLLVRVLKTERRDVDLARCLVGGVIDGSGVDTGRKAAGDFLRGEVPGPVSAELLEVGPEHVAGKAVLAPLPKRRGVSGMRQVRPDGAHHRVVESDQRLGDLVG